MREPNQAAALRIELLPSIHDVDADTWDALVPPDDPFCTHAFLSALEDSGSATAETGWMPAHVLLRSGESAASPVIGGAPAYVKDHSYGEYIFDWGWAEASQRAGLDYYPKVVNAVPFTPATGRRLLVAKGCNLPSHVVENALQQGLLKLREAASAHSVHTLFCTEGERQRGEDAPWIGRVTSQFHWHDQGYGSFDGWLSTFRSKARKEARRERRRPQELDCTVEVVPGTELTAAHWQALHGLYTHTVQKKWARAYLSPAFFHDFRSRLAPIAMGLFARRDDDNAIVAGALAFQRGHSLFGRYWGCRPGFEPLHFELCYHRPIELCLTHGWTRFEAGAQGQHKLKRGLMPAETHSLHWLDHPGLARAVADAVAQETHAIRQHHEALATHGPFKRA